MKLIYILPFAILTLAGCASITPQGSNVVVYSQNSSLLNDCQRLGNVSANVSAWGKWDKQQTIQQAENNIRDQASQRYNADTVVILNTDNYLTSATVQGIAFKCNK